MLKVPSAEQLEANPIYFGKKAVVLTPKQWELVFADEPEIAFTAGYGAAKTYGGICRATRLSTWYPGGLGLVGRYASTDLAGTTRNDCIEFWTEANLLDDFVQKSSKYKVPTATIKCVDPHTQEIIKGKYSTVLFVHFDDPTHIHGHHSSFGWMDEANECTKVAYDKLLSRMRRPGFDGLYSTWVTSNTDMGYDFIWDHFVNPEALADLKIKKPKSFAARRYIHATTYENQKNLPPSYIENMENSYSEKMARVYLMGSYESFEGQMYEEWSPPIHVVNLGKCFPSGIPKEWKRLFAVDPGGTDPWAWEFAAVDPQANVIFYDEIYGPGNRVAPFAERALPKIQKYPHWQAKIIDSENKLAAGELAEYGIICTNAQKTNKIGDANSSFYRVCGYLHPNPAHAFPSWHPNYGQLGSPRLFVGDNCKHLIKEFPQQRWKMERATGKLVNEAADHVPDHAVDALTYIIRELPKPSLLEKSLLDGIPAHISKMGKIMNTLVRVAKEDRKQAQWRIHMGSGRHGGRRSLSRYIQ